MYHGAVPTPAQSVLAYIRKHDLLRAGDRVGVAVSGGADSVGLLRILLELGQELGVVLSVVHLNHSLRGAESDGDERFVSELAASHDLQFVSETCNVRAHAADKNLSPEAAAREVRYDFFERLLHLGHLDKIATAHTLDDQAETVLLKLLRGAGTRGLAGIYPKLAAGLGTKSIVRPLLATRRGEVETYLNTLQQRWREDSSNRDLRHTRNRIRREILPELERHVNPGIRDVLADTAEIARAEEEVWSEQISRLLPQVLKNHPDGGIGLGGKRFSNVGIAWQRRLLRAAAESLGLHLEFRHVEQVLAVSEPGRAALPEGWSAVRCKGEIRIEQNKRVPSEYEYELKVPSQIEIREVGMTVEATPVAGREANSRPGQLLDSRLAQGPLLLRNWRPGDRFWPPHSKEPRKMKELLQDRHVTGDEKKRWPVIASGDDLVWVRGFGIGRNFQAKNGRGVLIREVQIEDEMQK
jgi:tRNA(Ile)-lysidine synthase